MHFLPLWRNDVVVILQYTFLYEEVHRRNMWWRWRERRVETARLNWALAVYWPVYLWMKLRPFFHFLASIFHLCYLFNSRVIFFLYFFLNLVSFSISFFIFSYYFFPFRYLPHSFCSVYSTLSLCTITNIAGSTYLNIQLHPFSQKHIPRVFFLHLCYNHTCCVLVFLSKFCPRNVTATTSIQDSDSINSIKCKAI